MRSFLEHVAEDILKKHGTDLSRIAVVFPNKRASLFLNDALARHAGQPLWAPTYITISDLFRRHSALQVADPIKLVCDLYRTYTEVTGFDTTLDHFYGWGQLLISDFDDIDKNLAPADKVFANLRDLHELDDTTYLTEEQKDIIRQFFSNFSEDHNSLLKERFLRLWSHMGDIYHAFNQRLAAQGLAYEGALYRQVVENSDITFEYKHYLFVGFNLLQEVEQQLFAQLRQQDKACFYWDFDHGFMQSEAGHFISKYLDRFPNELDNNNDTIYRNYQRHKDITFVSSATEDMQARYVSSWLREQYGQSVGQQTLPPHTADQQTLPPRIAAGRRTAIVLCNEGLLQTVIHSLPDEVTHVNITTGYPLQQSPVTSLVSLLLQLQTTGYDHQRKRFRMRQVVSVLAHPYTHYISTNASSLLKTINDRKIFYPDSHFLSADEGLTLLFGQPCNDNSSLLAWLTDIVSRIAKSFSEPFAAEALFRTYTLLNRLATLVDSGDLTVDTITLQRLIAQLIQQTSIPFHGEPAVGLQIMGVLETRNLDFDHLLMLSTNEGNIPQGTTDSSFIPYSIRRAFGLTTADHRVAIYAYYFHRLIAKATDITLLYNNATTDGHTGEMSRFMLQMLVGSHPIRQLTLQAGHNTHQIMHHAVPKTLEVVEALRQRFDASLASGDLPLLTPTAINRYMRCPLQFYYRYVENLREPDETDDDTIDNRVFGNIFHEAARLLYTRLMERNATITASAIDSLLKDKVEIDLCVDKAIIQELFRIKEESPKRMPDLNGLQIINREVIKHYLRQLLELDRKLTPFTILSLEQDVVQPLTVSSLGITTTIGGRIDRLDMVSNPDDGTQRIRVIDYKTGGRRIKPLKDVEAIFDPSQLHNHSDYYLQTLLYARLVSQQQLSNSKLFNRQLSNRQLSIVNCQLSIVPVAPALLFIQHASTDDYDPILRFGSEPILDIASADGDTFARMLNGRIEEIFNPATHFVPTTDSDICRTCPYARFCGH